MQDRSVRLKWQARQGKHKLYLLSGCQLTEMSSPACVLKYINSGLETCSSSADSTEECWVDSADVCCIWDDDDDMGAELLDWLVPASEPGIIRKGPAGMHTVRDQKKQCINSERIQVLLSCTEKLLWSYPEMCSSTSLAAV